MAKITNPQKRPLREALFETFDEDEFALMVSDFLGKPMQTFAAKEVNPTTKLQKVIDYYNSREIIELLVRAALAWKSTSALRDVAESLHIGAEFTPTAFLDSELQRVIDHNMGFIEGRIFRDRWARAERQVCRIEYPVDNHIGSGFLVGSDVVITNYHVMKTIVEQPKFAPLVVLRFDYEDNRSGMQSITYKLAADWLIDHSPPNPTETNPAKFDAPALDQLDYTLMRLSEKIGDQLLPGSTTQKRGWVKPLPPNAHDFDASPFLAIVQYPQQRTLSTAWDNQAFKKLNVNKTRVRYRANTEGGSSGSPCFNSNWELVALHHLGGSPKTPDPEAFNQGIPFPAILALLEQRGKLGELDK